MWREVAGPAWFCRLYYWSNENEWIYCMHLGRWWSYCLLEVFGRTEITQVGLSKVRFSHPLKRKEKKGKEGFHNMRIFGWKFIPRQDNNLETDKWCMDYIKIKYKCSKIYFLKKINFDIDHDCYIYFLFFMGLQLHVFLFFVDIIYSFYLKNNNFL